MGFDWVYHILYMNRMVFNLFFDALKHMGQFGQSNWSFIWMAFILPVLYIQKVIWWKEKWHQVI